MLVLRDKGWLELGRWIDQSRQTTTHSDVCWGEVVSAMALRVRHGALPPADGNERVTEAIRYTSRWAMTRTVSDDLAAAAQLVGNFDLKLRFPDAIHIAIARRLGATLVTADLRQAAAAIALTIPVHNPLKGAGS